MHIAKKKVNVYFIIVFNKSTQDQVAIAFNGFSFYN